MTLHKLSITDAVDNQTFRDRINALTPTSRAEWGKMNVAQMLAHCQVPLKVALGDIQPQSSFLFKMLGRLLKGSVLRRPEFRRNSPTFPEAVIADERDFVREREQLLALVERFSNGGKAVFTQKAHPFFGTMTPDEWNTLQSKHLDHHLRQFGV